MNSVSSINIQQQNPHVRAYQDANGLHYLQIENALATATIALQGAHIMHWQPKSAAEPVLWLSSNARFVAGRSIRGGTPICWPWFGAHPTDSSFCPHGFARVIPWEVTQATTLSNGATRLMLTMGATDETKRQLSYPHTLSITITVGETLKIALATTNHGAHPFMIGEAFHTYFNVSDVGEINITGLEQSLYSDKVHDYQRLTQQGKLEFNSEFDRVYINNSDDCTIVDKGFNRAIRVAKSGSNSTVIWTPWAEKAAQIADMGTKDEWRKMICVESANALENSIVVNPHQTHTICAEYSIEAL